MDSNKLQATADGKPAAGGPIRRLAVIVNAIAGRRRHRYLSATLDALKALDCSLIVRETSGAGDARRLAAEFCGSDAEALVVAGGDGTINEAINGLHLGRDLPLAIIPLGTANVLAREIGLGSEPEAIASTIVRGEARAISLGEILALADDNAGAPHRFVLMAGAGFDARVVARADPRLKRWIGKGAYLWASLVQLVSPSLPYYRISLDGQAYDAASVIVANGRHYAGSYLLAPEARLEAPVFQVCLFEGASRRAFLRYGAALRQGRLAALPDVRILAAREVVIEAPQSNLPGGEPLQGDGDLVARLPVRLSILPNALRLLQPAAAT